MASSTVEQGEQIASDTDGGPLLEGDVLVYGPNPDDPQRTGGVASHMRYVRSFSQRLSLPVTLYYVDVFSPGSSKWLRPVKLALGVLWCALRLLFKDTGGRSQLVHVNTSLYPGTIYRDIAFMAAARLRGFRLFIQVHGGRLSNLDTTPVRRWLWRQSFHWADGLGVHAGPQWNEFTAHGYGAKMHQMLNMVPASGKTANVGSEAVRFLSLGRVVPEKGVHEILSCFTRLQNEGFENISLTIAGSGSSVTTLRREITEANLQDVTVTGFVSGAALQQVMDEATVFLLPSRHQEGFPFSFLECAERGMVCIVTKNSAIPEVFVEGKEFLAIRAESEADLHARMKMLVEDVDLRQQLGQAVQSAVNRLCTIDAGGKRFLILYRDLLNISEPKAGA